MQISAMAVLRIREKVDVKVWKQVKDRIDNDIRYRIYASSGQIDRVNIQVRNQIRDKFLEDIA